MLLNLSILAAFIAVVISDNTDIDQTNNAISNENGRRLLRGWGRGRSWGWGRDKRSKRWKGQGWGKKSKKWGSKWDKKSKWNDNKWSNNWDNRWENRWDNQWNRPSDWENDGNWS